MKLYHVANYFLQKDLFYDIIISMKAFIFDPLWDDLITKDQQKRLANAGIETIVIKDIAPLKECAALLEGNEKRILCLKPYYVQWKLPSEDYKDIPHLKAILGGGTSLAWIDPTYADEHAIPICNIRNFSTQAVAEWAITMLLNVARQTPLLIKHNFPLDFNQDYLRYRGQQLQGKTVGIIGLGNIGMAIAKRCEGLGMKVTYWSRKTKNENYHYCELSQLFAESDVIFPTMTISEETKTIITNDLITSAKSSAMIITVVKSLMNESLLLQMVKEQKLFGFGFEAKAHSFTEYEGNVWAAPAYAWVTEDSMKNLMDQWIENMILANKGEFPTQINR